MSWRHSPVGLKVPDGVDQIKIELVLILSAPIRLNTVMKEFGLMSQFACKDTVTLFDAPVRGLLCDASLKRKEGVYINKIRDPLGMPSKLLLCFVIGDGGI